ncbi:MAG: hypothetical protein IJ329_03065 [Clostridia bacterium]|nr:hypothetical protein [Clostridia bacterium]
MENTLNEIKELLKDITVINQNTIKDEDSETIIDFVENPLEPNLLAYCFDNILGFEVQYRIFEKVNYIIDFDYKGTHATVRHYKMSYNISIHSKYKDELVHIFQQVKPLLEKLFMIIGENSLTNNNFSMKNETNKYLFKLEFYEEKIEKLEKRKESIVEKTKGLYDVKIISKGMKMMTPKGAKYLRLLESEITYDIETYIDTFFSALEHILTLLFPFTENFSLSDSYYKSYIRNSKWSWDKKLKDVLGTFFNEDIYEKLKRIKEIYRNHNAHGSFSREMMAYVQIPQFGRYPLYIGKEYLKGFIDGEDYIDYKLFQTAKSVFNDFWGMLDSSFELPMLFLRSGLAIPVDTSIYTKDIDSLEKAQWFIDKMRFDIDNQSNMDW